MRASSWLYRMYRQNCPLGSEETASEIMEESVRVLLRTEVHIRYTSPHSYPRQYVTHPGMVANRNSAAPRNGESTEAICGVILDNKVADARDDVSKARARTPKKAQPIQSQTNLLGCRDTAGGLHPEHGPILSGAVLQYHSSA